MLFPADTTIHANFSCILYNPRTTHFLFPRLQGASQFDVIRLLSIFTTTIRMANVWPYCTNTLLLHANSFCPAICIPHADNPFELLPMLILTTPVTTRSPVLKIHEDNPPTLRIAFSQTPPHQEKLLTCSIWSFV